MKQKHQNKGMGIYNQNNFQITLCTGKSLLKLYVQPASSSLSQYHIYIYI